MKSLNSLSLDELFDFLIEPDALDALIDMAHREDVGPGDLTGIACIEPTRQAESVLRSREAGRLAGAKLLPIIAARYDEKLQVDLRIADGSPLQSGDEVAVITGPLRSILAAERVMLNFLCHLSGIASLTARYVQAVQGTDTQIYDTRKTIPGLRRLAKYAVRCGGGCCHRIGLHDAVLIKDNHIAHVDPAGLADYLRQVIDRARQHQPRPMFVEIEVDDVHQLREVLECDVDIILLDNFTPSQLAEAVDIRDQVNLRAQLEASGGVNLHTVAAIAKSGVDRISVGALTHSAPALDLGLDIDG